MTKSDDYNQYLRDHMRNKYNNRRARAIEKLGGICSICGTTDNLEFDHRDPKTKTISITKALYRKNEILQLELEKCQLLCLIHHREKSKMEQSVEHGEGLTGKKSCYCSLCGPLKQKYRKKYKRTYQKLDLDQPLKL